MSDVFAEILLESIRPDAVELFTPTELNELKEWVKSFRKSNMSATCSDVLNRPNMLCIPPKSKELKAAIKRVSLKIMEQDRIRLEVTSPTEGRTRVTYWDGFKV